MDGLEAIAPEPAGSTRLTNLVIDDMAISDLVPPASIPRLKPLEVDGTAVRDLSPLTKLAGFGELKPSDLAGTDLSPLFDKGNLRALIFLKGHKVDPAHIEKLRDAGVTVWEF